MNKTAIIAGLGALMAANVACAEIVSFSTGNYYQSGIGDEIGSTYDIFQIDGMSKTYVFSGTIVRKIADYTFTVGPNCYVCDLTPTYTADFTMTVGTTTKHLSFEYYWQSAWLFDTVKIDTLNAGTASPVSFDLGDGKVLTVQLVGIGDYYSFGGAVTGSVDALLTIAAVPEPETYALFLAGLGTLATITRRRRNSAAIKSFAQQ